MENTGFILTLEDIVGKRNILISLEQTKHYRTGFRSGEGDAAAVVFPDDLLKFWRVLQVCVEARTIIIMQAANTGLTEGSTPSGYDYERPVIVINTRKMDQMILLGAETETIEEKKKGRQLISFPGTTLYQIENALKPLQREPHSVIGSSCIGASVIGGVANNSGGALIQRGPAYTELALYAQVNEHGHLELINHLGISLGDTPEEILSNLQDENFSLSDVVWNDNAMASDIEYKKRVKDVDADSPARFNADPRRLFESSGCAGKLAVFAVRLDTFKSVEKSKTFYIGTKDSNQLNQIRRHVLKNFKNLPVLGEYIHRDAFNLARVYGKDTFLAINIMGTRRMPQLFAIRGRLNTLLNRLPFMPKDFPDKVMQWLSSLFPEHLPQRILEMEKLYAHHLIIKMSDDGIEELTQYLTKFYANEDIQNNSGHYIVCTKEEEEKAMLHRFAVAGAAIRYYQMHEDKVEDILALDVALKRNETNWVEELPESLRAKIFSPIYYGHFFCHVFHQDYLVKKGESVQEVKQQLLELFDDKGAKYPAEHNVGHIYEAANELKDFYQKLDPTNTFNPGIGKTTKHQRYCNCC